ncbi:MAG TPA: FAD-dependent oxidoreductase [Planctomycetota bacterium]|nr:FAD-dependent oxidoreductase [Planctomycetota bacterium]
MSEPSHAGARHGEVDVVVVGAGVIGLTTALALCERGLRVAIWTRDDTGDTVSAVAGAIWYPFLAEPRERVLAWSGRTFQVLQRLSRDPATGVHMQAVVEVFSSPAPDLWWAPAVPAFEWLPPAEVPRPYAAAIRLDVPVCDSRRHLAWLQHAVRARGGTIERRTVAHFDEAFDVAPAVVNCTGLGAAALCDDRELYPVRGQVVVVRRGDVAHALIDDNAAQPFYLIPRGGELVLGGTAQVGDSRMAVDAADTASILGGMRRRVPALAGAVVHDVRVGLRPCRSAVRLELESRAGRRLVHDYGHGGAGYTLAWGCAEEVAALLGDAG